MTTPGIPKDFWNARFSEQGFAYGERASRLLLAFRDLLRPGQRALVPACGEGRDAVFLAECGLDVTAVDMSAAVLPRPQTWPPHAASLSPVSKPISASGAGRRGNTT